MFLEIKAESPQALDSSQVPLPTCYNPTPHYLWSHRHHMRLCSPLLFSYTGSSFERITAINKAGSPDGRCRGGSPSTSTAPHLFSLTLVNTANKSATTHTLKKTVKFFSSFPCSLLPAVHRRISHLEPVFSSFHPALSCSRSPLPQAGDNCGSSALSSFQYTYPQPPRSGLHQRLPSAPMPQGWRTRADATDSVQQLDTAASQEKQSSRCSFSWHRVREDDAEVPLLLTGAGKLEAKLKQKSSFSTCSQELETV